MSNRRCFDESISDARVRESFNPLFGQQNNFRPHPSDTIRRAGCRGRWPIRALRGRPPVWAPERSLVGADILFSGALAPDAASLPVGSSLRLYFLTEHVLTVGLSEHEFIV